MNKSPEQLYEERERRVNLAVALETPDRVPVMVLSGFFPVYYAGITCKEAMYSQDMLMVAQIRFIEDFMPDMADNPFGSRLLGSLLDVLDYRQLKWAGHGLSDNTGYQFIENEYMKADEYDQLLYDPTDFLLRTYWPRTIGAFSAFQKLPPLNDIIAYYMGFGKFSSFDDADIETALQRLLKAARAVRKIQAASGDYAQKCRKMGYPMQSGSLTQAPFDTLSDFFRGTTQTMLDMYRRPDKLLAAVDKLYPLMLNAGLEAGARGIPRSFIPIHKGIDGFMSTDQFKRFFWPTLKRLIEELIAGGVTPYVFWEGCVDSRLEIIADIPPGKAVYGFERTNIFKAKEVLGDVVCLKGNVPLSILNSGTEDDVEAYCRKLIKVVGNGGGYIMDASTVLDDAKPNNVNKMFSFTKEYGVYS